MSKLGQLAAARAKAESQELVQTALMVIALRAREMYFKGGSDRVAIHLTMAELQRLRGGDRICVARREDGILIEFVPAGAAASGTDAG